MRGFRAISPGISARQPRVSISTGSSRTFLALARTPILSGQDSNVALCVGQASLTNRLGRLLLVEIAQRVATDATELPLVGLKVT